MSVHRLSSVLVVVLSFVLLDCSTEKKINSDELRSKIKSAISLAAETQLFIDYVQQGRSTRHYAEGHARYIYEEASEATGEVRRLKPDAGAESAMIEYITGIIGLQRQLATMQVSLDNPDNLAVVAKKVSEIQSRLQSANSLL